MNSLIQYTPDTDASVHVFLFSIHDWIAYMTGQAYCWHQYDTSLCEVIAQKTKASPLRIPFWITQITSQPLSLYTLLYRHYLVDALLEEEIFTTFDYAPLYSVMASLLTDSTVFHTFDTPTLWDGIDTEVHPINGLRVKRPIIKAAVRDLAMREDVSDDRTLTDHALLSSVSLMYGLYLVRVILIHELTVRPNRPLNSIAESLSNTLTQLKGVFTNV